jgi:hypothetical protein
MSAASAPASASKGKAVEKKLASKKATSSKKEKVVKSTQAAHPSWKEIIKAS